MYLHRRYHMSSRNTNSCHPGLTGIFLEHPHKLITLLAPALAVLMSACSSDARHNTNNVPPVVPRIAVTVQSGGRVDVSYDITDIDDNRVDVTLAISVDSGRTYTRLSNAVTGD